MERTTEKSDFQLAEAIKNNDVKAFTAFYQSYKSRIYAQALFFSNSETIAEEVTQEVFLKLWESRAKINPEKSLKAFTQTISRNLFIDYIRKDFKKNKATVDLTEEQVSTQKNVIDELIFKEYETVAKEALANLPPIKQQIFMLRHQENLSYNEIAAHLHTTPKAVERHLARATSMVKEYLSLHSDIAFIIFLFMFN